MKAAIATTGVPKLTKKIYVQRLYENIRKHKALYLMALPVILYYLIFHYIPMFGTIIAFQDFKPAKGYFGSEFVGLKHFIDFLSNHTALRTIRNTLVINILQLVFGFPAPIILALLINEIKNIYFKKTVQTISYMPHFISIVVVCGILKDFCMSSGIINDLLVLFGLERENLLSNVDYFRTIYVLSGVWQSVGWGSILYLATLSGIDQNLYEASVVDGAGRFRQTIHITIPALVPIIVVQLIMRVGSLMSEGSEKVLLLYSPLVYEHADIISTYVYRRGLQEMNFSFGTAVGLFNSLVNLILLTFANYSSKKLTEESLW